MKKGSKAERIRRKLVKAQHQLILAQETRTEAVAKGEAEVAAARTRAAARVIRRTEQVERLGTRIAALERQLGELQQETRDRTKSGDTRVSKQNPQEPAPNPLHAELTFLESRLAADAEQSDIGSSALDLRPTNGPTEGPSNA